MFSDIVGMEGREYVVVGTRHTIISPFSCVLFFFFFQAEDGIRDTSVTGVQTCALPILIYQQGLHSHAKLHSR